MPWFQEWKSDNDNWNVFTFTTKFNKNENEILEVVGETVYVPMNLEHYDNPEHPSNLHYPFDEKARKRIPKYVREKAEEIYKRANARFLETSFIVSKDVVYDHQRLIIGDPVERIEEWKKAPEGHYIARFRMPCGDDIPLMMDEVVLVSESNNAKIGLNSIS